MSVVSQLQPRITVIAEPAANFQLQRMAWLRNPTRSFYGIGHPAELTDPTRRALKQSLGSMVISGLGYEASQISDIIERFRKGIDGR